MLKFCFLKQSYFYTYNNFAYLNVAVIVAKINIHKRNLEVKEVYFLHTQDRGYKPVNNEGTELPFHPDILLVVLIHLSPLVVVKSMTNPDFNA